MLKMFFSLMFVSIALLLTACGPACPGVLILTPTPSPVTSGASQSAEPSPGLISTTVSTQTENMLPADGQTSGIQDTLNNDDSDSNDADSADLEDINDYWSKDLISGWKITESVPPFHSGDLPGALPVLSAEDNQKFDPDKIDAYLVGHGAGQRYNIDKAEVKNGVLLLTLTDDIYDHNVNGDYQFLKNTFSLPDNTILNLPVFDGCVIHDGYMYADKDAWKSRQEYNSENDWEASSDDDVNCADLDFIDLSPLPVAPDAKIYLVASDDWFEVTPRQLIEYLESEPDLCDNLNYVDIEYNNGNITGIVEEYCP